MAGRKKAEEAAPEKTAGIEENFARLEEIIKKLETGEIHWKRPLQGMKQE